MYHEDEIWKDIPGYDGAYAVSNLGRVKSLARKVANGNGLRKVRERILRPGKQHGWLALNLSQDNKQKMFEIGELVLVAFVSARPPGRECRRLNKNKQDSRLTNLYWGRPDRRGIKMTRRKKKIRRFWTTYFMHRRRPRLTTVQQGQ